MNRKCNLLLNGSTSTRLGYLFICDMIMIQSSEACSNFELRGINILFNDINATTYATGMWKIIESSMDSQTTTSLGIK